MSGKLKIKMLRITGFSLQKIKKKSRSLSTRIMLGMESR